MYVCKVMYAFIYACIYAYYVCICMRVCMHIINFQFQLLYCNPKPITIMQHNYILEKLGNNGKPKRDADPAN